MDVRTQILDRTPDAPDTFELRSMLLDPTTEIRGDDQNGAVRSASTKQVVLLGSPDRQTVEAALSGTDPWWQVLAHAPREDLLPGWRWERATTVALDDPSRLPRSLAARSPDIRPLTREEIVHWVTPETAPVVLDALAQGPVVGGWSMGLLVSMAYSLLRSDRYFHPTLFTFRRYRGRGFSKKIARSGALLVALEHERGRLPVATALDSNTIIIDGCLNQGFRVVSHRWHAFPA